MTEKTIRKTRENQVFSRTVKSRSARDMEFQEGEGEKEPVYRRIPRGYKILTAGSRVEIRFTGS